jgi:hypothetical protein
MRRSKSTLRGVAQHPRLERGERLEFAARGQRERTRTGGHVVADPATKLDAAHGCIPLEIELLLLQHRDVEPGAQQVELRPFPRRVARARGGPHLLDPVGLRVQQFTGTRNVAEFGPGASHLAADDESAIRGDGFGSSSGFLHALPREFARAPAGELLADAHLEHRHVLGVEAERIHWHVDRPEPELRVHQLTLGDRTLAHRHRLGRQLTQHGVAPDGEALGLGQRQGCRALGCGHARENERQRHERERASAGPWRGLIAEAARCGRRDCLRHDSPPGKTGGNGRRWTGTEAGLLDEAAVADGERAAWNGLGAIRHQAGVGPGRLGHEGERDEREWRREREARASRIDLRVVREGAAAALLARGPVAGVVRRTVEARAVAGNPRRPVPDMILAVVGGVTVGGMRSGGLVLGGRHQPRRLVGGDAGDRGDLQPRQRDERQHRPGQPALSSPDPLQTGHRAAFPAVNGRKLARPPAACNIPIAA